jgi:SprT-like family
MAYRHRRQSSGIRQLKEQLIAEGELPDIKRAKAALRQRSAEIPPPYRESIIPITGTQSYDRKAITPIEYSGLQAAYDHFNAELFGGKLGDVFITYQRRAHSFGYFSPDRFSGRVDQSGNHELALNPDAFINQTDEQVCQTLTHEMVHVWQHAFGKPSKRGYHNAEWATKMKAIGLQPSSTGMVGGKETGQKMMDYIIPNGLFTKAYTKLAATGWKLNLQSAHRPGAKGGVNSKTKFTCVSCGQNAWGKPDLAIVCELCGTKMLAADAAVPAAPSVPDALPLFDVPQSYEPTQEAEPVKRKRGRPKGSKNKPKAAASYEQKKRKPGRPKGSKNQPKARFNPVSFMLGSSGSE